MSLEESCEFNCPYCSAENSFFYDPAGGKHQKFVHDCTSCFRPIQIKAILDEVGQVELCVEIES